MRLLELIHLAYIDDKYHEKEKAVVAEITESPGLSNAQLGDIGAWVVRQEAKSLMESAKE